ncbi:hypothetical protein HIM_08311 [Hirsutella minnesotensis 3608]|uniref:Prion-inhibition and propagation HeLo domain-containing protein n=1 Tax=Hirsutella minnesotensis 3608 TaxID=1043627 RepID=A0A0F7ZMM7_9HYPO|nr:hypothetical protein HIM_08311 [Hirsutella minnesotensis 3608]
MAEVFGTVAGALSVAALFNNCVDCFDYIQLSRHFGRDFERCQLKLDIAKMRMGRWGQAVAINEDPRFTTNAPGDNGARQVRAILEELDLLFQTVQKSSRRYELGARPDDLVRFEETDMQPAARRLHSQLSSVARQRQKRTGLLKKAAWALYDGKNMDKLVGQITEFVDDLEKLFPVETIRRQLVEVEIEAVDDEASLLALQNAAVGTDGLLSEAAALKVARGNYAETVQTEGSARVRVGDEWSESVLVHGTDVAVPTANAAASIAAKGGSAVHVGNNYGGRGIFDD